MLLRPPLHSYTLAVLLSILCVGIAPAQNSFQLVGHKGCRGLMPENTFPGFIRAVELGVDPIHMEVVMSKDGRFVLSGTPWISSEISSHPDGRPVDKKEEKDLNIYAMDYADIQHFDCGQRFYADFPEQRKIAANMPTLKMVGRMVMGFAEDNQYAQPDFIIEIISDPKWYGTFQPEPKSYVEELTTVVQRLGIADITTLISSDINILEALNNIPEHEYAIGYVVTKGKNLTKNLAKLTFAPDVYLPDYSLVSQESVKQCHEAGIRIIPFTINNAADMERIKSYGVDGAMTDFVDVVR